mmetsp:Transcript_87319/g.219775  ORF Transcript_87319/g.219775 Transcript_87319/m.219775 type:complete len:208 (-) Transcript_87319:1116-1739(-)
MLSMAAFTLLKASNCTWTAMTANLFWGSSSLRRQAEAPPPPPPPPPPRCPTTSPGPSLCAAAANKADARLLRAASAKVRAPASEATCTKEPPEPVPIFLWKRSRASSSVKMEIASDTACISSPRVLLRCFHWWSKSWHFRRKSDRNCTSEDRVSRVIPRSSFASDKALALPAASTSISSSFTAPVSISFSKATFNSANSSRAFNSSF